jgi:peptide deformylase
VANFEPWVGELIEEMADAMFFEGGMGLAANQLGFPFRAFVIKDEEREKGYQAFVNPVLLQTLGEQTMVMREGCLSVDDGYRLGVVARPKTITATWRGVTGKFNGGKLTGLKARVFLHELDHLDGALYLAREMEDAVLVNEGETRDQVSVSPNRKRRRTARYA